MALTQSILFSRPRMFEGDVQQIVADVSFDNSYTTGGLAINPAALGINKAVYTDVTSTAQYLVDFDYTNQKLKVYTAPGTEVANATNLSALTVRALIWGA